MRGRGTQQARDAAGVDQPIAGTAGERRQARAAAEGGQTLLSLAVGAKEIETLASHGIPFQVVPGITAATGAASYAGIPLTRRHYAQSCVFVTGHLKDGSEPGLDWLMLARPNQTIVVYMASGLSELCRQLIAHGLPAATSAAIIQQGIYA